MAPPRRNSDTEITKIRGMTGRSLLGIGRVARDHGWTQAQAIDAIVGEYLRSHPETRRLWELKYGDHDGGGDE